MASSSNERAADPAGGPSCRPRATLCVHPLVRWSITIFFSSSPRDGDAPRDGPDVAVYWDVRRERSDSSMSVPPEMDVAAVPREYAGGDSAVCPA